MISNAIKYRSDRPLRIEIDGDTTETEWRLWVRDNGIGFPESQKAKMFEAFTRLAPAGVGTGTGLGLFICKRIIDSHGGRIWAESTEGVGSTFFLALPRGRE